MAFGFHPCPKPRKRDRLNLRLRRERKKADRAFQAGVPSEGICQNCKMWKPLVGDHIIKRRFLKHRHDPNNRRALCASCNVEIESLAREKLIAKYPHSDLLPLWKSRRAEKGKVDMVRSL